MLLNYLFNSVDDLWEDYKKILEMSYDLLLDKSEQKKQLIKIFGYFKKYVYICITKLNSI